MEPKRPQLNATELHQLRWLLGGAVALLAAWTVFYMDVQAWVWLALISAAVPVMIWKPALAAYVPRWAHRLAFPLLVAVFTVDLVLQLKEPLPPVIRLALMLVLYRVISPRARRDDLQLIILGLFLVVVAGVISVSMVFAAHIVVFTAVALAFLLNITLLDTTGDGGQKKLLGEKAAWMDVEWRALFRRLRACVDGRVMALGAGLFVGVVVLSGLLFFLLPRFEIGSFMFMDNLISRKPKSGFSEDIEFGKIVDIQNDTSVALRVDISDLSQVPVSPYWRMLVLDVYQDGRFKTSDAAKSQLVRLQREQGSVDGTAKPRAGSLAVWTFYLESGISRFLPTLGSFTRVTFEGPQRVEVSDSLRILALEKESAKMLAYKVEGMRYEAEFGEPEMTNVFRGTRARKQFDPDFLQLALSDADRARVEAHVAVIGAPAGDARAFARAASTWLERNHRYSLQVDLGSGEDDRVVRWMGSKEGGHCELFAGSFLLLARVAGYPTRLVTGFRGGAWIPQTGHMVVRNSDAHAWCEIFDAKTQTWVRTDPTPGGVVAGETSASTGGVEGLRRISESGWAARIDSLRMLWYRRVVNFDQSSQVDLAVKTKKAVEERSRELKEALKKRAEAFRAWLTESWDWWRVSAWVAVFVSSAAVIAGWKLYGRSMWLNWRSGWSRRGADPVRREAGRWLRKLGANDAGDDAAPGENAGTVRAELERLRYGPRERWPEPGGAFRRARWVVRKSRR